MSTSEALAAWKLFLETTPPNTSVKFQGLAEALLYDRWCFDTPHIQLHCEIDRGPRRFAPPARPSISSGTFVITRSSRIDVETVRPPVKRSRS